MAGGHPRGGARRGRGLATLVLVMAGVVGCASGNQPVVWTVAGPVDVRRGYRLDVIANVDMPAADIAYLRWSIAESLDEVFHGRARRGDGYTIRVVINRYDAGNAAARFMLAGLGQMYLDGDVHVYAGHPARTVRRGGFQKNYSWGGIVGGAATMEDNMLAKVGDAIATALQAPAGADGASIPPPPSFAPPPPAPAPAPETTPAMPTIAAGPPASGAPSEAPPIAAPAPVTATATATATAETALPAAVVPAASATVAPAPAAAVAKPAPVAVATARQAAPPPPQRSARRTAGWVFAGVSLAAAGVGIPFGVRAMGLAGDVNRECPSGQCSAHAVSLNHDAKVAARVADVAFGTAIVSAGVAAVLLLSSPNGDGEPSKHASNSGVTLQLGLAPGLATLGVGGRL